MKRIRYFIQVWYLLCCFFVIVSCENKSNQSTSSQDDPPSTSTLTSISYSDGAQQGPNFTYNQDQSPNLILKAVGATPISYTEKPKVDKSPDLSTLGLKWDSTNGNIKGNGNLVPGNVTIVVTATDGSGVSKSTELSILINSTAKPLGKITYTDNTGQTGPNFVYGDTQTRLVLTPSIADGAATSFSITNEDDLKKIGLVWDSKTGIISQPQGQKLISNLADVTITASNGTPPAVSTEIKIQVNLSPSPLKSISYSDGTQQGPGFTYTSKDIPNLVLTPEGGTVTHVKEMPAPGTKNDLADLGLTMDTSGPTIGKIHLIDGKSLVSGQQAVIQINAKDDLAGDGQNITLTLKVEDTPTGLKSMTYADGDLKSPFKYCTTDNPAIVLTTDGGNATQVSYTPDGALADAGLTMDKDNLGDHKIGFIHPVTPGKLTAKNFTISVTASNGYGNPLTQDLTITVDSAICAPKTITAKDNINHVSPFVYAIGDKPVITVSVGGGAPTSLAPSTEDANKLASLNLVSTFDSAKGQATIQSKDGTGIKAGTAAITIKMVATNAKGSDSQDITFNVNQIKPTLSYKDNYGHTGLSFTYNEGDNPVLTILANPTPPYNIKSATISDSDTKKLNNIGFVVDNGNLKVGPKGLAVGKNATVTVNAINDYQNPLVSMLTLIVDDPSTKFVGKFDKNPEDGGLYYESPVVQIATTVTPASGSPSAQAKSLNYYFNLHQPNELKLGTSDVTNTRSSFLMLIDDPLDPTKNLKSGQYSFDVQVLDNNGKIYEGVFPKRTITILNEPFSIDLDKHGSGEKDAKFPALGNQFTEDARANFVLAGVRVRAGGGTQVNGIQAVWRNALNPNDQIDGPWYGYLKESSFELICPQGSAVVGFRGFVDRNQEAHLRVGLLGIICHQLNDFTSTDITGNPPFNWLAGNDSGGNPSPVTESFNLVSTHDKTTKEDNVCDKGAFITQFSGRAGVFLDQIQGSCSSPYTTTRPPVKTNP